MWEVFALTSLIFTALGIIEYRRGNKSFNYSSDKGSMYKELKLHNELEYNNDTANIPKNFIRLRFNEDSKSVKVDEKQNHPSMPLFKDNKSKEEAKRIWENHYIVRAVKERFSKGEDRNYGVYDKEKVANNVNESSVLHPPNSYNPDEGSPLYNNVKEFSIPSSFIHGDSRDEVSSLLPEVVDNKENNKDKEVSNTLNDSNNHQQSLPGVFGSLLEQRKDSSSGDSTKSGDKENKGEEFNPFDVLGNL